MIAAYAARIQDDASTVVVFDGPANRVVVWSASDGEIEPIGESATNAGGRAMALYRPLGYSGPVTVQVNYAA